MLRHKDKWLSFTTLFVLLTEKYTNSYFLSYSDRKKS